MNFNFVFFILYSGIRIPFSISFYWSVVKLCNAFFFAVACCTYSCSCKLVTGNPVNLKREIFIETIFFFWLKKSKREHNNNPVVFVAIVVLWRFFFFFFCFHFYLDISSILQFICFSCLWLWVFLYKNLVNILIISRALN